MALSPQHETHWRLIECNVTISKGNSGFHFVLFLHLSKNWVDRMIRRKLVFVLLCWSGPSLK